MKIYFALLLLVIVSCNKTKINSPIVGKWSLDSIYTSIGGSGKWEPAVTLVPVTLTFSSDGSFSQSNSNLNGYNHYELLSNDTLRLFNLIYQKELKVKYSLDGKLTMHYNCIQCIEGWAEKYKRTL